MLFGGRRVLFYTEVGKFILGIALSGDHHYM